MQGLLVGLCASALLSGVFAEVWEFDRQGNVLVSPDIHPTDKTYYDGNGSGGPVTPAVSMSTRSVNRAIYRPMAEGVAKAYAADPAIADAGLDEEDFVRLFVALIDQESRFNPQAVSPKGARGLGQLMPDTAARLGVDAGEPMENLHGAARYLTAQLAEFGRVDWALAAYNAGPERVAQFHGLPPYRETRDYVAKITTAADVGGVDPVSETPQRSMAQAAAPPRPEVTRALTSAPDPELLEPAAAEPTPLDQPVQGTVLEWKR